MVRKSCFVEVDPPDRDTTVTRGVFFKGWFVEKINSKRFYGTPNPFFLPLPMFLLTFPSPFHLAEMVHLRQQVWLVNGSSDRDKEWHALDMYQSASAGIPWSTGDACKLVYSSFPCVLFWSNFTRRRRQSHQMDLRAVPLAGFHLLQ